GPGTMAAFLGLEAAVVEEICREAASAGLVAAANWNAPGQVVVSGEIPAVERACELARARGAKRAVRLEVSGAFHSPLMATAAAGLAAALDAVTFRDPRCPVVVNVSAAPLATAAELRAALGSQLLGAVRWEDSMRRLRSLGAEGFVELGSGTVLRGSGGRAQAFAADVSDTPSVDGAFEAALAALGKVDILVNNAGVARDGLFLRMNDEQWREVIETNLGGAFRCCRAVARPMIKARSGRIVTVSSVVGQIGNAGQANYAAAKAGLLGLTKSWARELALRGMTGNAVG